MGVFTFLSPGGSPGVTTSALAISYGWGGRALLAECDRAGGNVLAGFLAGQMEARHGLLSLTMALGHRTDPEELWNHVISLDQREREWLLLPGLRDPREAAQLEGSWDAIAATLRAATSRSIDVLIDLGRIGGRDVPYPLVAASDMVIMVLRPTLRQVAAAKPRLDALGRRLGTAVPVHLCLVDKGDYPAGQVRKALFGLPILGELPFDSQTAALLSDGRPPRKPIRTSALLRGAAEVGQVIRAQTGQPQAASSSDETAVPASWEYR